MRELQESITSAEFGELMAYHRAYGIPDAREHHYELMALLANLHAPRKAGGAWSPADFDKRARARAAAMPPESPEALLNQLVEAQRQNG